jgi:hypothetical protein
MRITFKLFVSLVLLVVASAAIALILEKSFVPGAWAAFAALAALAAHTWAVILLVFVIVVAGWLLWWIWKKK